MRIRNGFEKKKLRSNLINDSLISVLENKEAHSHQEFPGVPPPVPYEEMLLPLPELSRKIEGPVLEGYSPWERTVEATNVIIDHECNTLFSFHNNVGSPAQAEYSYFSDNSSLEIFLRYS